MGDIHKEEVEKGADSSSSKPEGDLVSMMSQMMEDFSRDLKQEMREWDARMDARRKEFETRWKSNQNTLVGALKEVPCIKIQHIVSRGNGGYREYDGKECGMNGDDRGDYESRYHEDGLERRSREKRALMSHGECHSRRVRDHVNHKGFERLIEEEVPYRAQLRPTYPYGGVDTNQRGNSSSHLTTSSSFHFSHKPLDVYGNVSSSMSLNQFSREKEREREKRLESESESKKPRERDKRQECEVQKSRESGGGERKEKYQMREKPQAQEI
ncbi:splicing regulatory glutamine/lysine-rich protein 1-like [Salvia hispanica]|uniref:splicing regulatory glutamine/lysine-rich protein 1-like n=1 Tax=Salvia hispanica TaxID=49212 RepID=UPI0020091C50|nr:splicing regulatory glutamine/lysine-rich protein 1-like [Salvia hispanica]